MLAFPERWFAFVAAGLIIVAGNAWAESFRLAWEKPANGAPVDFYSVYQLESGTGQTRKLGDTTNCFWVISSFSTNQASAWRVTVHVDGLESEAAQLEYHPGATRGPAAEVLATTKLLSNGGFEEKTEGWHFSGDCSISASPGAITPEEGKHCVVFNLGERWDSGQVSQAFPTTSGDAYEVSFEAGVISFGRKKTEQALLVTAKGKDALAEKRVSVKCSSRGKAQFTAESMRFVADSDQTTLTFRDASQSDPRVHLLLDDIRIRPAD